MTIRYRKKILTPPKTFRMTLYNKVRNSTKGKRPIRTGREV